MTTTVTRVNGDGSRPVLWRVTSRRTFEVLRREGRRARRGPLAVTWIAPSPTSEASPPQVAFTIGRRAGGAVVRNRLRRRLRAALRDLLGSGELPGGTYLLSAEARAAQQPWSELVSELRSAVREVTSERAP